jgi:hypothetical protein
VVGGEDERGGGGAGFDAELVVDAFEVLADGAGAYGKDGADFFIGFPLGAQASTSPSLCVSPKRSRELVGKVGICSLRIRRCCSESETNRATSRSPRSPKPRVL